MYARGAWFVELCKNKSATTRRFQRKVLGLDDDEFVTDSTSEKGLQFISTQWVD